VGKFVLLMQLGGR